MTVSEAAFNDLVRRLDVMEASISSNDPADSWKEIDTIEKPTQKWSGRIHFDWWPMPDESPLANYLDTGNRDTAPRDMVGFRRARIGIKGDINETMEYQIKMG